MFKAVQYDIFLTSDTASSAFLLTSTTISIVLLVKGSTPEFWSKEFVEKEEVAVAKPVPNAKCDVTELRC